MEEENIDKMTKQEIINSIFSPGFSTKKNVSMISGRGVGLDDVKKEVEAVDGKIRIYSKEDVFTAFLIILPYSD